jgi:2'-5' RNA ligase
VRLFTGIAIPDETRSLVEAWVHPLRKDFPSLRWASPEQWHVTLQFLGETDETNYACIVDQMRRLSAAAVNIELSEPGMFEHAGVFLMGIRRTPSLLALHELSVQRLKMCGFESEARPYNPHITLARRKGRGESSDLVRLLKRVRGQLAFDPLTFTAREFLLYQSVTDPSGSKYEVRERFPLM